MRYIFFDTNNWIYLSNGFNILNNEYEELHFKIFDFIVKQVDDGRLTFLTNNIIFEEWERNNIHTQHQIVLLRNKLQASKASLKAMKHFLGKSGNDLAESLDAEVTAGIESKIQRHKKHIEQVATFIKEKTTVIDVSDNARISAAEMALRRKAPFIGAKKNSMADALILLSSIEYVDKHLAISFTGPESKDTFFPDNYFVSSNKGDFSSTGDPKLIHPDLAPLLQKTETQFYYSIAELVNNLESEFLTEEESEWIDSQYSECPHCHFEYANTVSYSEPYRIYDPNREKLYKDPKQMGFNFNGEPEVDKIENNQHDLEIELVEAHCSHCDSYFFVCPNCGELNDVATHNRVFSCEYECGYHFILHTDIDKKGVIHGWEFEIVAGKICQKCGESFFELSDSGLCEECEEFYATEN